MNIFARKSPINSNYILRTFFLLAVNLRKTDVMVNSTGSNNETDLSLKCPEDGKRHTGTAAHQLEDDECDIIGTLIGDYGRWQFLMTLLLALFQIPNTFHIYSPTFQVSLLTDFSRNFPLTKSTFENNRRQIDFIGANDQNAMRIYLLRNGEMSHIRKIIARC